MEQYISKSALVAETERRIKTNKGCMLGLRNLDYYQGKVDALNDTISFIDTLEVKEVDLDGISRHYALNNSPWDDCMDEIQDAYKAGFELGLKTQRGEEA